MATRDGGMDLYALAARNEFAPGFDQLGTVQAISAQTAATEWLHERHTATISLVATGGGLLCSAAMSAGTSRRSTTVPAKCSGKINRGSAVSGFPSPTRSTRGEHGHRRYRHRDSLA